MSARDDYPVLALQAWPGNPWARALDEIDRLRDDCETWEQTVERLNLRADAAERKAEEERQISRVAYDLLDAWHEMAEDLWEELQQWHMPDCVDTDGNGGSDVCVCHRILADKWDELVGVGDVADDDDAHSSEVI